MYWGVYAYYSIIPESKSVHKLDKIRHTFLYKLSN